MADTSDFRNGLIMSMGGEYWVIKEFLHVKPGKGGAFVRTKIKNLLKYLSSEWTHKVMSVKFPDLKNYVPAVIPVVLDKRLTA